MTDDPAITRADRATAVFEADPAPVLRCSHCGSDLTDDDADCPRCLSPIDWGASMRALDAWLDSTRSG